MILSIGIKYYTFFLHVWYNVLYLSDMKLMTVRDYAKKQKKSIPLIYKKIREGTIKFEKKFGKYLIKTK